MCWRGEGRGAGMRQMHPTANSPLNARLVRPALKLLRACDGVSLLPKEAHSPEAMESIKLSAQRVVHLTKLHAKRGGGWGRWARTEGAIAPTRSRHLHAAAGRGGQRACSHLECIRLWPAPL